MTSIKVIIIKATNFVSILSTVGYLNSASAVPSIVCSKVFSGSKKEIVKESAFKKEVSNNFFEVSHPGLYIYDFSNEIAKLDIDEIKTSYPVPLNKRRGKISVFSSSQNDQFFFEDHPEYLSFYQQNIQLVNIVNKVREKLMEVVPSVERQKILKSTYRVSLHWSSGEEQVMYDHIFHVHRDNIVGILNIEGAGVILKNPSDLNLSDYTPKEIYELDKYKGGIKGQIYQTMPGQLAIVDSIHHPDGGLHAAPSENGLYPPRLILFVSFTFNEY